MKKIIRITEQQLGNVITRTVKEQREYPVFIEHWENKFNKAVDILLNMGHTPDDLINKIQIIYEKTQIKHEKSNKIN